MAALCRDFPPSSCAADTSDHVAALLPLKGSVLLGERTESVDGVVKHPTTTTTTVARTAITSTTTTTNTTTALLLGERSEGVDGVVQLHVLADDLTLTGQTPLVHDPLFGGDLECRNEVGSMLTSVTSRSDIIFFDTLPSLLTVGIDFEMEKGKALE